jgi:ribosome-associated translation inhibitor RaiA
MQVLLHTDSNTDNSQAMAEHVRLVVSDAISRFGERVTRVEAHLANAHSLAKSTTEQDIHCTVEAHLVGLEAVVVKAFAGNAHQAIEHATKKLKRAIERQIERHHTQSGSSTPLSLEDDPDPDELPDFKS